MVFRRRQSGLHPVNRIKHVVDKQASTTAGTAINTNIISTVDAPVLSDTDGVETGSTVNGIYARVEISATSSAAIANVYMIVGKSVAGDIVLPAANAVGASDNKRFVIHQEMVMLQKNQNIAASELGGNPRTLFNGVIVFPRGMRRCAPNDIWQLNILSPGVNIDACMQIHYKEFR